ncbi:hypothetical protein ACM26W_05865 [Halomonas sp. HK25]
MFKKRDFFDTSAGDVDGIDMSWRGERHPSAGNENSVAAYFNFGPKLK